MTRSRLVIAVSIAGALAWFAPPSTRIAAHGPRTSTRDTPVELAVQPASIVWLDPREVVFGAGVRDVAFAIDLCRRSRVLPIRAITPETDGACAPRRFLAEAPRRVVATRAFGIDRHEVTFGEWNECVAASRCPPSRIDARDARLAAPDMPVVGVTWAEAQAYCAIRGGRLPTEIEWERAAGGAAHSRFPWGRAYDPRLANHGRSPEGQDASDGFALAAPVGSFPAGASAYGLLDVAGNAWELTASAPSADDVGPGADPAIYRVIRGGSWSQPAEALRVTHRAWVGIGEHESDLGFRCAYDARR